MVTDSGFRSITGTPRKRRGSLNCVMRPWTDAPAGIEDVGKAASGVAVVVVVGCMVVAAGGASSDITRPAAGLGLRAGEVSCAIATPAMSVTAIPKLKTKFLFIIAPV